VNEPRESRAGRFAGCLTVLGLFGLPVWGMLTAAIIQVFPGWVGYDPSAMIMQVGPGGTLEVIDARPTAYNWMLSGSLSAVLVLALVAMLGVGGVLQRVVGWWEHRRAAQQRHRYAAIAGEAVLEGVELTSRSRHTAGEDAAETESDRG